MFEQREHVEAGGRAVMGRLFRSYIGTTDGGVMAASTPEKGYIKRAGPVYECRMNGQVAGSF
jgi:hypothetical protein